jgi:hypothetical protein
MGDETTSGPEMNLSSQGEVLQDKGGISLYKSSRFNIFVPSKPNIPLNEGLHVKISDGYDTLDSPKEVLARYLVAEGVAKMLAESGITPGFWANTRLESGQTVSSYGLDPKADRSRKPVNTLNRGVAEINSLGSDYDTQKLQELCDRYLPRWEQLAQTMDLFKNGVNGQDTNEASREGFVLWQNEKIKLEVIMQPHLKGLHLLVSPKESYRRQWQTIKEQDSEQTYLQRTIEITAVAMGVQKLLADGRGELHNSGNWAGGLKSTKEGGKLDLENLTENRKAEKRSHRPDIAKDENQIGTNMHTHVYLPTEGPVILPEMSKQEAIEKGRMDVIKLWKETPQTTPTQVEEIRTKLGEGKLTKWLEENCKGRLYA